jgi:hypothetical protein
MLRFGNRVGLSTERSGFRWIRSYSDERSRRFLRLRIAVGDLSARCGLFNCALIDHEIRLSGMERTPLESRAVRSAGYDPERQTLELEFATGRVYLFEGVPQSAYDWLLRTPSKGVFVSRLINGRYPYRDITPAQERPEPERDLEAALRASVDAVQQRASASIRDYVPDDDDDDVVEAPRQESLLERALRASIARSARPVEPRDAITPAVVKLARSSALERVLRASVERRDREQSEEPVLVGVRRRPGEASDE